MRIIKLLFYVLFVIAATGLFLVLDKTYLAFERSPAWPISYKNYVIDHTDGIKGDFPRLKPVPDLTVFTMDNLLAKIPVLQNGKLDIVEFEKEIGLVKFAETKRIKEFISLQGRARPIALRIDSGVYDLESLQKQLGNDTYLSRDGNVYLLKVPLYVGPKATLVIRGSPGERTVLHMSSDSGAFIASGGRLFVVDAEVSGWDDSSDIYAEFDNKDVFRPFITLWSGSQSYMGRSYFRDLGYAHSKSYGISFSTSRQMMKADRKIPAPTGWVIQSRFEGLYYGFYSYEAEDVAIVDNVYANNIIYGIDPHDRSKRLIIAGNEAYGTHKKHGIIVSREVNDSWIVNNVSHHNHRSGFMLDRTSVRNLVANNVSYENGADGLTLFESQDNVVVGNKIHNNRKNGMRIRNSWNVVAHDNVITGNDGVGVQIYKYDIAQNEDDRDFKLDPFTEKASLYMYDTTIAFNRTGGIKVGNADLLNLKNIEFYWYKKIFFRGDLIDLSDEIAIGLRRSPHAVSIVRGDSDPASPDDGDNNDKPGRKDDDEDQDEGD